VVEKGVDYFQKQGYDVVHASHFTPAREVPHPNLGTSPSPAEVYDWVRSHAPSSTECVMIAGSGFRSIGMISALEKNLRRPVITANQVAFWYALRLAGVDADIQDYGELFRKNLVEK